MKLFFFFSSEYETSNLFVYRSEELWSADRKPNAYKNSECVEKQKQLRR